MIKPADPILVIGAGSIGERHIDVLQGLGYANIYVYRQRNLPLRNTDTTRIRIITAEKQIDRINPRAAIICTPTSQHMEQALYCAERGIHALVEKPLSHRCSDQDKLRTLAAKNNTHIQVAYMLRYHPFFRQLKRDIESKKMGRLLSMQSCWSEYLPDWHPWEDYRQSYAARKALGGGAALTLSHDIDLANWLSGSSVASWQTLKDYHTKLETDTESAADISIAYKNGVTAHCHLNFHQKMPERWYRYVFEEGTLELDFHESKLTVHTLQERIIKTLPPFERNQLYALQTMDFFKQINEGRFANATLKYLDESETIISICQ